jgi:hypothetical protein
MKTITTLTASAVAALALLAGCGGNDSSDESGPAAADTSTSTAAGTGATGAASEQVAVTVPLDSEAGSDQYGSAQLVRLDEGATQVVVELYDGPRTEQAAAIVAGTCDDPADTVYELQELNDGRSATRVDASLDEILQSGSAIRVGSESDVTCGDLASAAASSASRTPGSDDAYATGFQVCSHLDVGRVTTLAGIDRDDLEQVGSWFSGQLDPEFRDGALAGCRAALQGTGS